MTLNQQPLTAGKVSFIPLAEGPAAVATIKDGRYQFTRADGPLAGVHRVEIEATDYLGFAIDDEHAYAAKINSGWRPPPNPVPPQYNTQSTLRAEVGPDAPRKQDYALEAAPREAKRR